MATQTPLLTVKEVCDHLNITKSTWDKWRAVGRTPPVIKLPNRQLRIDPTEFELWLAELAEAA